MKIELSQINLDLLNGLCEKWDCSPQIALRMALKYEYDKEYGDGAATKLFNKWMEENLK